MKKNLVNEFDLIDSVIVHTPNIEHNAMTPKNLNAEDKDNYLLFDDVLYLEKAIKEHKSFTDVIKKFTNKKNCFELIDLLKEVFNDGDDKGCKGFGQRTWKVVNGEYKMTSKVGVSSSSWGGAKWKNYTVKTTVRVI